MVGSGGTDASRHASAEETGLRGQEGQQRRHCMKVGPAYCTKRSRGIHLRTGYIYDVGKREITSSKAPFEASVDVSLRFFMFFWVFLKPVRDLFGLEFCI